jgi:hypothetical protein
MIITLTDPDCTLDSSQICVSKLRLLDSCEISRIVGVQQFGERLEYAKNYSWSFSVMPIADLALSSCEASEPEGGWAACYLRFLINDEEAVRCGSPEYAGRDAWIKSRWCVNTHIYPLFIIKDASGYRLLDGHHRLAGAFHYQLTSVAVFVGSRSKDENSQMNTESDA